MSGSSNICIPNSSSNSKLKEISIPVFYGTNSSETKNINNGKKSLSESELIWIQRLERLRRSILQTSNNEISRIWKVFPLQKAAFEYQDNLKNVNSDLAIFAFEPIPKATTVESEKPKHIGGRKYVVTTYDDFWDTYRNLPQEGRHFYEVIRESTLCHLYFGK